jgi:hypothetical protein
LADTGDLVVEIWNGTFEFPHAVENQTAMKMRQGLVGLQLKNAIELCHRFKAQTLVLQCPSQVQVCFRVIRFQFNRFAQGFCRFCILAGIEQFQAHLQIRTAQIFTKLGIIGPTTHSSREDLDRGIITLAAGVVDSNREVESLLTGKSQEPGAGDLSQVPSSPLGLVQSA